MPKIRCHYLDCTYLDDRYCCAAAIELNPEKGCLTYAPNEEAEASWDEDGDDEWDTSENEEEPEDLWASDEDEADEEDEDEADPY